MLYRMHRRLNGVFRILLMLTLMPFGFVRERAYAEPASVGYRGWLEAVGMTLAFRRTDGTLQFTW